MIRSAEAIELKECLDTIQRAKHLLDCLGHNKDVFLARFDRNKRFEMRDQDPAKTETYFDYVNSLRGVIQSSRRRMGYRVHTNPGRILNKHLAKKLDSVKAAMREDTYRLHAFANETAIQLSLRSRRGRKYIDINVPHSAELVPFGEGLIYERTLVERSSLGSIWYAKFLCCKTFADKQGHFAEAVDKTLVRCPGLPTSRKHLQLKAVSLYSKMM